MNGSVRGMIVRGIKPENLLSIPLPNIPLPNGFLRLRRFDGRKSAQRHKDGRFLRTRPPNTLRRHGSKAEQNLDGSLWMQSMISLGVEHPDHNHIAGFNPIKDFVVETKRLQAPEAIKLKL
jgi:hypothetical protein